MDPTAYEKLYNRAENNKTIQEQLTELQEENMRLRETLAIREVSG